MQRSQSNTASIKGVPRAEKIIIHDRPHWLFIITGAWKWIMLGLLLWALSVWIARWSGYPIIGSFGWIVLSIVIVRLIVGAYDWVVREHILTDARIIAQFGILRTIRTDLPLRRVQHLVLVRPLAERMFGLGSIGVASAGTGSIEVVWRGLDHPARVLATIREHTERVGAERVDEPSAAETVPVIGLVGGIGSGKSTVAQAFAKLGCFVSDSDEAVREVLRRPEVIDRLVSWWGERVLDSDGQISRSVVANIVFDEPDERFRLEELVHPLIRDSRRDLIERARNTGAPGVIIDAPLLYEAGVDAECDAVVFVDTALSERQRRVRESRGWTDEELDRRERAQLSVEEKRAKADWIIPNQGDPGDLGPRASEILRRIRDGMMSA